MNTKQSSRVFVGVFATFSALSVAAPFTVEHYTLVGTQNWQWDTANEGTEYTVVENPPDSNNWDFTLIDPNNVQWNIKAHDPAVDSINQITETAGGAFFTVIVGDAGGRLPSSGPYDHALTEPMSPGCKNFNGVMSPPGDGTMKLVVIASGSINGTIDVEEAARLRAVNITADIENDATAVKPINILTTGNFSGSYLSWGAKLQSLISPRFTGLVDIRGEIGRIETT
ncbi:MAG: hypothetical protein K8E66_14120, partial [Phycisphaerales bacterium]|nr:hypothetical protein [Phycisphaerales bacterium]